ncbi:hypothetical protein [Paraburkholderia phenazinium]|uniref:Uncharacterized protein n=1 Tax=Paraburkholderia phenazinium TaxID=60549 RepID=A0A1G8FK31_9BURK|nr:hypothetical protein [Paraburkholderia phenazinium]SDH82471.1 hypothetical protein SAMN05216466_113219 [Paraburkholderia phenazinium]
MRQEIADLLGRDVNEISAELDEIDACVRLYDFNKGEIDAIPKRSVRAAELRRFKRALATVLLREDTVERLLSGVAEYAVLLDAAQKVASLVDETIAQGDESRRRGPDPDDRGWLITKLAEIFEVVAQEKATVTTDPVTNEISGHFFEFARLAIPRALFADVTLGDQIKRHLRAVRPS